MKNNRNSLSREQQINKKAKYLKKEIEKIIKHTEQGDKSGGEDKGED